MTKPAIFRPLEAGCDEAGRGCLAGPVYAAAVILPEGYSHPLIQDSKKLTPLQRRIARNIIMGNAVAWAIARVDHQMIDRLNIYRASMLAMHKAIDKLNEKPRLLLIDGNRFIPYTGKHGKINHRCIVHGDATCPAISAASILAKTARDTYMERLHRKFPFFGWKNNKGYPTGDHRNAILRNGISPYHRKSFKLYEVQQKFEFV